VRIHKIAAGALVPALALGIGLGVSQGATAATQPRAPVIHTVAAVQATPYAGEALHTMSVYYREINWHNYAGAWNLFQANAGSGGTAINPVTGQTYGQFVAGYATTADVTAVPVGDVLTATTDTTYLQLKAIQTDGSVILYNGWYTVNASGESIATGRCALRVSGKRGRHSRDDRCG
jgi:hypothetical protein